MTDTESKPKLLVILGPTASGKTDLAIALAKKFGGEIISADSRQFYRGLDIGADIIPGKWVKRGRRRVYVARGVPHHLIAFRSPAQPLTAADFKGMTERLAGDIAARGRLPIVCGGTGLYLRTITDNLEIPPTAADEGLRARLNRRSAANLYAELHKKDPVYASRIPPQNKRYIVRALEVIRATGRPFSEQQGSGEPKFDILEIGIQRPRPAMYRRIDERVDRMMKQGLLDEAKRLGQRYGWSLPTTSSLGHKQLGAHLRGEITLEEAVRQIKRDTRHFAKRQVTWFKRDSRIKWVKKPAEAESLVRKWFLDQTGRSSRKRAVQKIR